MIINKLTDLELELQGKLDAIKTNLEEWVCGTFNAAEASTNHYYAEDAKEIQEIINNHFKGE